MKTDSELQMNAKTLLHIGAEQTVVTVGRQFDPATSLVLAIGSQKTARDHFKHLPPRPLEVENAIAAVEDEVTRAKAMIPPGSDLSTADAGVREIALHSGVVDAASMRLSIDALERTFDRFAAVSLGRPAAHEGLPDNAEFAATLLILREFMHHLQFAQITIFERTPKEIE
jgi:hypothetical protein